MLSARRKHRVQLWWAGFALVSLATFAAVHRLHETVQDELHEQSERALQTEQAAARERVRTETEALRLATIKTLAGFHVEGLGHALREWDEANEPITGTFRWETARGFLPGSVLGSDQAQAAEIVALWQEFRTRRVNQANESNREDRVTGTYHTIEYRTIDNAMFSPAELGYQHENLEMLVYAKQPVDPWAGWAGHRRDPLAPWVFWYQAGPDAPVRGCLLEVAPLVADLRAAFADHRLARLQLLPVEAGATRVRAPEVGTIEAWLPGYTIVAEAGDIFVEKQSRARFAALVVALFLGVFLVGLALLALTSRREARDAERKATFVTQVSHELRTPLTSIRMFADMLAAPDLAEEKRTRFATTISRESERLSALIERLLLFSALEKGKRANVVGSVDVSEVVRETLEEMEGSLQASGMRTETTLPAEPVIVATDRATLKQVLLNLLDNAQKYARAGRAVHLTLAPDHDAVRLRVADEGPGIARALSSLVFEPFVQGGQTLTDKPPGVGLGLSIARELLRNVGGDLVLLPSARGAVFEIRLPHAPPS